MPELKKFRTNSLFPSENSMREDMILFVYIVYIVLASIQRQRVHCNHCTIWGVINQAERII